MLAASGNSSIFSDVLMLLSSGIILPIEPDVSNRSTNSGSTPSYLYVPPPLPSFATNWTNNVFVSPSYSRRLTAVLFFASITRRPPGAAELGHNASTASLSSSGDILVTSRGLLILSRVKFFSSSSSASIARRLTFPFFGFVHTSRGCTQRSFSW